MVVTALISIGLAIAGYLLKGAIHGKLIAAGKEVKSLESRLGMALAKEEAGLRADIREILADIEKL